MLNLWGPLSTSILSKFMAYSNYVGIDISKNTLDLILITSHGEVLEFAWPNDREFLRGAFEAFLRQNKLDKDQTLFCAEYTGHFGNKLVDVALGLTLNLWLESPYAIRHSQGLVRGKNDKIDALRIAEYAKRFVDKAKVVKANSKILNQIKHLHAERTLLLQDLTKYKAQLKQEDGFLDKDYLKEKKKRVAKVIASFQRAISEVEQKIDRLIGSEAEIKFSFDKVTSVEGIGKQTAIATIVATDNFKKFDNPRKFACHAGCAPFRYDSGTSIRSRNKVSHKANKDLKKLYHMAALSILTTSGELKHYYERKVAQGKNKMSVINAIRSKLIHRVFAVVRENRKNEKNYTPPLV